MDDYLSKPINRDLLYTTVTKWLATAHHADEDPSHIFGNS